MSKRDRIENLEDEQLEQIDISQAVDDIWKGFKRFWYICFIIVILSVGFMYARARYFYTPVYTAYSTYTVIAGKDSSTYTNQSTAEQLGKTMEYVLTSNVLRTMVAEDLGDSGVYAKLEVSVMEGTNLFTISATASDGQYAYDVLQSVIRKYPVVSQTIIGNTELELMDESGVPATPSNLPDFSRQLELGVLIGIVLSLIFLMIYSASRHTIQKEEDFKKYLNVDCFGVIPKARFKRRGKKGSENMELVLMDNRRAPAGFKESIRSVRSRLERKIQQAEELESKYAKEDETLHSTTRTKSAGGKIILVTSSIPGEGKSTVASNIALSLALKGKNVVVADMDLRNPSLARTFGMEQADRGVIDVLAGKCQIDDAAVQYKETKLKIIPGGKPINNTARALSVDRTKEFLEQLRGISDYVIVDTPPCAMLFDATLVAKHADHAVFVVRQDFARTDRILEGISNLADSGVNICGCILNQAQVGVTGYGYSKNYGYGRYGYGYGSRKNDYGYGGYGYGNDTSAKTEK